MYGGRGRPYPTKSVNIGIIQQSCGDGEDKEPSTQPGSWALDLGSGATMALPPGAAQGVLRSGTGALPMAVVGLEPVSSVTSIVSSAEGDWVGSGFTWAGTGCGPDGHVGTVAL